MPPIRDGLYHSTIQYRDTVQSTVQRYGSEFSQRCKVYAESKIYAWEMDKKNARLARSQALIFVKVGY
jgi:transposase-like protein